MPFQRLFLTPSLFQAVSISNLVVSLLSTVSYVIFAVFCCLYHIHNPLYANFGLIELITLVEMTRVGILSAIIHLKRKQSDPQTSV